MQPSGSQEIQTQPRESQDNPSTRRVLPTRRFHDEDIVISRRVSARATYLIARLCQTTPSWPKGDWKRKGPHGRGDRERRGLSTSSQRARGVNMRRRRREGDEGDSSLFHAAFRIARGCTRGVVQEGDRRHGGEVATHPRFDAGARHAQRGGCTCREGGGRETSAAIHVFMQPSGSQEPYK